MGTLFIFSVALCVYLCFGNIVCKNKTKKHSWQYAIIHSFLHKNIVTNTFKTFYDTDKKYI